MSKHEDQSAPPPTPEELASRDEQVHVPKGQSRARFLMILGLMIFTLVIYVVPAQFTQVFRSGDPAEAAYVAWTHPVAGAQELDYRNFMFEKRRLQNFLYTVGARDTHEFIEDEQAARVLLLDRLAADAGVEITDSELKNTIRDGGFLVLSRPTSQVEQGKFPEFVFQLPAFGDAATYKQALERAGMAPVEFQETLRMLLRIERYESLLSVAVQPDPSDIEKAWKKQHQEHGFEFVVFDLESAKAEAEAQNPDEATLRAWYEGLDLGRKRSAFSAEWLPERVSAELVQLNLDDTTEPTKLLEKYPRPAELDLEKLAQDYYNQFANIRFRRAEEKADGATAAERLYLPFEEVADKARRESKIHAALVEYSINVQTRLRTGLASDALAIEAAELGLSYVRDDEPHTQAEWTTYPGVGDATLAGSILRASRADQFVPLYVGATHIVFGRSTRRVEAGAPPFESVAARVLEEWRKDQAFEIANGRAKAFHDLVKVQDPTTGDVAAPAVTKLDAATFAAKAESVGAKVIDAGWIDETKLTGEEAENPTEVDRFVRELAFTGRALLRNEEGQVSEPLTAFQRDRIYVVRKVGVRDPEKVALQPREFEQIRSQAAFERVRAVRDQMIGLKGLEARYRLAFPGRKAAEENVPPPPPEPAKG